MTTIQDIADKLGIPKVLCQRHLTTLPISAKHYKNKY